MPRLSKVFFACSHFMRMSQLLHSQGDVIAKKLLLARKKAVDEGAKSAVNLSSSLELSAFSNVSKISV